MKLVYKLKEQNIPFYKFRLDKLREKIATRVYADDEGIYIIYHNTIIFNYNYKNHKVKLNTDGWYTRTTKERINQCFRTFLIDYLLYQQDYIWYIGNLKTGEVINFKNDMILDV